jgi:hypothetical protein
MSSPKESVLQSKFLNGLSKEKEEYYNRVFARSSRLSEELRKWVAERPNLKMRAARVPQLSLTLAAATAHLDGLSEEELAQRLLPAACLSMWLFAVDDWLDEFVESANVMLPKLEQYLSLLKESNGRGGDVETEEPLLEALRDIRDRLKVDVQKKPRPCFERLHSDLFQSLRNVLGGMRREYEWNSKLHASSPPSFDEYLEEAGRHSIGVLPVYLCVLITLGDDSLWPHLDRLLKKGNQAAICIRLANDLRSYEREIAEGKLNSIALRQRELLRQHRGKLPQEDEAAIQKKALEDARGGGEAHLSEALKTFVTPGRGEGTGGGRLERYLDDLVAFACDFYSHHDYHHTLKTQDGHDLDAPTSSSRS